jgi:transcription-repair coupling factor (superfamily II helicase)
MSSATALAYQSLLKPDYSEGISAPVRWGRLYGSSFGLACYQLARQHDGLILAVTRDSASANRLQQELAFYACGDDNTPVLIFPDWETLPYDAFSPHQDIISQRLETLYRLPDMQRGVLIAPVDTLMHRVAPRSFVQGNCFMLQQGENVDIDAMRNRLEQSGYRNVTQVMEHGEYAVRGNLMDLYPMGSAYPYRIDLFDNEIESLRTFDPETQRTQANVQHLRLLPAREFPLTDESIQAFRQRYRVEFDVNPNNCPVYRDIGEGLAASGIEYYLPLFFDTTETLFDYLPDDTLMVDIENVLDSAEHFHDEIQHRYENLGVDDTRPLLHPDKLFLGLDKIQSHLHSDTKVQLQRFEIENDIHTSNFATSSTPRLHLNLHARTVLPGAVLKQFIDEFNGRVLLVAETGGRREVLLDILRSVSLRPEVCDCWQSFIDSDVALGITVAPLDEGLLLEEPRVVVLAEAQLFGEQVLQKRRRRKTRDSEQVIRNLTELAIGSPVVHEEHGVGRYQGLTRLNVGDIDTEFLVLEYADSDKLYVPVSSLHLISRYTGVSPENAPLHKLGSDQWSRARRRAAEKVRDVAAELLAIYAKREAREGYSIPAPDEQYDRFAEAFPFEETPDQEQAIEDVVADMQSPRPMDRLICGDVGFGKTEVAMRAAFLATSNSRQVAVLVPTTLLAQQHLQNFRDRFADWPVRVEMLSRFVSKKEQDEIISDIESGKVDIIIGTHKLLQGNIRFKQLGLVILDEEHRFGVRQKEALKALRAEVDVLTLTATPIPRTLNMALSQIRDLSIISTPPTDRLAIKTFVHEWDNALVQEAILREIKRGGQVYFLHNEVKTIDRITAEISQLIPEASVQVAHGQMRERELEQVMLDFYHQRFNVLVCTTIIETGIDVPTANTIIMNRADKFGLAQLYQLRGRVGRSHHRAYAYLIIPGRKAITADAVKRLEAIESMEELGTGFMLATHDLEIRGAGELLGEEQSGQMQEIGFTLYTELLERAVNALRDGEEPELDRPLDHGAEIDLGAAALIPDDYMPDVHNRLVMYKRIASASDTEALGELQVEMIDRFGLMPDPVKNLFRVTEMKLKATPLGIRRIEAGPRGGRLLIGEKPRIDASQIIQYIQTQPDRYKLDGKDKFRFIMDLPEIDDRISQVNRLLDDFGLPDEA